uniref:Vinculin n=1 Tax=Acrobeloides nanus TaxID=290746 RepID=A0A914D9R0_9BILA
MSSGWKLPYYGIHSTLLAKLHLAISVAEKFAAERKSPDPAQEKIIQDGIRSLAQSEVKLNKSHTQLSKPIPVLGSAIVENGLSRASSRRSLPEYVYPDTIRQVVTTDDCPICQIMLPKGPKGCVSRLVILHEEAEDGNAMPDLTRPVGAVSRAVDNLIKV